MRYIDADTVKRALPYAELVMALRRIYADKGLAARRELIDISALNGVQGACMAHMPAFGPGHDITTKIFTVFPNNRTQGLPTVNAVVLVFDAGTGRLKALVDGTELTRRRTAAMSALASTYLSRENTRTLTVCGAGALAPHAALAHAAVRPIDRIGIWARNPQAAADVAARVESARPDISAFVVRDLARACAHSDLVSCQTSSPHPLVFGAWIAAGAHLDLVGSHDPKRRECDDEAARISRIYVDVMDSAMREAGDILIPMANGTITAGDVLGDLSDLCRGNVTGRTGAGQITLFKSTGSALADMAAAELVLKNAV